MRLRRRTLQWGTRGHCVCVAEHPGIPLTPEATRGNGAPWMVRGTPGVLEAQVQGQGARLPETAGEEPDSPEDRHPTQGTPSVALKET